VLIIERPSMMLAIFIDLYGHTWAHLPHRMQEAIKWRSSCAPGGLSAFLLIDRRIDGEDPSHSFH
jgi:hypothetical protein